MFYLPSWHRALHLLLHLEFLLSLHVLLPKEVFVGTFLEPYCSQRLPPIILYQTVLTCLLHKTFHVKLHFSLAYLFNCLLHWNMNCKRGYFVGFYLYLGASQDGKESASKAGDLGSISGLGRREWLPTPVFLPGESCAQVSWAGVAESWTRLSHYCFHLLLNFSPWNSAWKWMNESKTDPFFQLYLDI